ncbi:unnamed protein product, partial [Rotaria sp. Silwood2]
MVDIEAELRLSVTLRLVPVAGISSLVDYPYPINSRTRFLWYRYVDREESFFNRLSKFQQTPLWTESEDITTHVIAAVHWGIDAILILQLPYTEESAIDAVLDKICQILRTGTDVEIVTPDEKRLLEHNINVKVYSNIPYLVNMTTVLDVCTSICRMKNNVTEHRQIAYRLCPVKWLYPHYSNPIKYYPLESLSSEVIEQYLLHISTSIKELKWSLDYELSELLREYCDLQIMMAYQQYSLLEDQYSKELQRIRELVLNIRRGVVQQDN